MRTSEQPIPPSGRIAAGALRAILAALALVAATPQVGATGLPHVLSDDDAERYRQVFELQQYGYIDTADKLIRRIEDRRLVGHVLAHRYLQSPAAAASYRKLRAWMAKYADQPDAKRIYRLALEARPKRAKRPRRPKNRRDSLGAEPPPKPPYGSKKNLTRKQRRRVAYLKKVTRIYLRRGWITKTEKLIARGEVRRLFDRIEIDEARSRIAAAWLYRGNDAKAYDIARAVAERSGAKLPMAYWTAGLAAWRLRRSDAASRHFEAFAGATGVSDWNRAAGLFWAARAHDKAGRGQIAHRLVAAAARHRFTFYGLLAGAESDGDIAFDPPPPSANGAAGGAAAPLLATKGGTRALALIQIGRRHRAEQELLSLQGWREPKMTATLMAVAEQERLPALAFRLAQRLAKNGAIKGRAAAARTRLFPIPPWQPDQGAEIDRALIYAFIRQESNFDPFAESPAGARGLMQLMPRTARHLAGRQRWAKRRPDLFAPGVNMDLGQRHLGRLLDSRRIRGNLLRLAAAYNGGQGNLAHWERRMRHGGDPLLFVESLPQLETRLFVKRVLANLWIYRARLGQKAPSLGELAAGSWPRYRALDIATRDRDGSGDQADFVPVSAR